MKKVITAMLVILALCLALTCAGAEIDDESGRPLLPDISKSKQEEITANQTAVLKQNPAVPAFRLPASLKVIDDEAFEGTAIVLADLPDTVEHIGERAFADIPSLRFIRIPENTTYIASNAFAGSNQVTLTAAPNSYARAWAKTNHIPFNPFAVIHEGQENLRASANLSRKTAQTLDEDSAASSDGLGKDPSWRPAEDIQFEQYDSVIANHRAGRAPPAWEV